MNIHYLLIGLALVFVIVACVIRPFVFWPAIIAVLLIAIELFSRVSKALMVAGLAGLLLTGAGCAHTPTLETGGTYAATNAAPDLAFYVADSAFDTAYSTLEGAFKFERDNRDALWKISPDIKHTLDKIRPTAWDVVQRYSRSRAVYMAHPAPANLTPLQTVVDDAQRLAATALAALPKGQ